MSNKTYGSLAEGLGTAARQLFVALHALAIAFEIKGT
jgi:hypothetical protein